MTQNPHFTELFETIEEGFVEFITEAELDDVPTSRYAYYQAVLRETNVDPHPDILMNLAIKAHLLIKLSNLRSEFFHQI